MTPPRQTLAGTRTEFFLRRDFFTLYLQARLMNGEDRTVAVASFVFTPEALSLLRSRLSEEALATEVTLTDRMSNRVLAVHLTTKSGVRVIAVNARFRVDPDVLTLALLEEFAHAQQVIDGVDFETQRQEFPYAERPYEQEAKQFAMELLDADTAEYAVYIVREEPPPPHYDRPSPTITS